jgi:hypothetical protein
LLAVTGRRCTLLRAREAESLRNLGLAGLYRTWLDGSLERVKGIEPSS